MSARYRTAHLQGYLRNLSNISFEDHVDGFLRKVMWTCVSFVVAIVALELLTSESAVVTYQGEKRTAMIRYFDPSVWIFDKPTGKTLEGGDKVGVQIAFDKEDGYTRQDVAYTGAPTYQFIPAGPVSYASVEEIRLYKKYIFHDKVCSLRLKARAC